MPKKENTYLFSIDGVEFSVVSKNLTKAKKKIREIAASCPTPPKRFLVKSDDGTIFGINTKQYDTINPSPKKRGRKRKDVLVENEENDLTPNLKDEKEEDVFIAGDWVVTSTGAVCRLVNPREKTSFWSADNYASDFVAAILPQRAATPKEVSTHLQMLSQIKKIRNFYE